MLEESAGELAHRSSSSSPAAAQNSEEPNLGGQQSSFADASIFGVADDREGNGLGPSRRPPHNAADEAGRQSSADDLGMTNPLSAGPSDTGFLSDGAKGRSGKY